MNQISLQAVEYIKKNKKALIQKFCSLEDYPPSNNPHTFFMAGSPGAGKTEFSKEMILELYEREPENKIVRIDADEIRDFIPQFNWHNSDEIQRAACNGLEKVYDHVQHHSQNAFIDGTFADYETSKKDVIRALNRNRQVGIFYLFQDPILAWDFTKKREKVEGRCVPKEFFIQSFINSRRNVNLIKKELGKQIEISLIIKNFDNRVDKTFFNIDNIDNYLSIAYNYEQLEKLNLK